MAEQEQHVGVANLASAEDLRSRREKLQALRMSDVKKWAINREFYKGNQWAYWNDLAPGGGRVESLGTDEGDKPRYRVRMVSNQILPGVQAYVSQLTKTKPVIFATPDSPADRDLKAAQMGERLYEYWWQALHMKSKLQTTLTDAVLAQGYWHITWDPQAGKLLRVMLDPTGQPITNPDLEQLFKETLQENGLDPSMFEQQISVGEIRIDCISGENMWIDPAVNNVNDAKYAIIKFSMDPDEVKSRFGKEVMPNSMPTDASQVPLMGKYSSLDEKGSKWLRDVFVGYFKPQPALPQGRIVVWTESPDEVLLDEPWGFPFQELPIVHFPGIERPDSVLDEALVSHVVPHQKELNRTLSQVMTHKNLTLKPQMLAPVGSVRQKITDEPGRVIEYQPMGTEVPQWREMPQIPPYVFEHLQDIQSRIDRLFNLQAVSRGDVPPNVEAGIAIDLLQEAAVDAVAPQIQRLEEALVQAGTLMARLAQKFYLEPRLLKIKGSGGSVQVKQFLAADLEGGFSFSAEAGSGLPRTRAGRQARIQSLVEMGVISMQGAAKYLEIADLKGLATSMAADEDQALREHDKILRGQPLNIMAMMDAQAALQQGLDPNTQQPIAPDQLTPEYVEGIMEQAGLQPLPYENKEEHLSVHGLLLKSPEFDTLPPEVQRRHVTHFLQTKEAFEREQAPQPEPPKTTFSLKGTVGPTVGAKILQAQGVDTQPEELEEPPLETSVYDSVDKPDAQATGNNPLDEWEASTRAQAAMDDHMAKQAKAAADMQAAEEDREAANFRTQQAHDQKMRHNDEMHGLRMAVAAQPKETSDGSQA